MYVLIIFKITHLPSLLIFSYFISCLLINTFLFAKISSDFLIYLLFDYFMFRSEYFRVLLNCGMSESLSKSHSESRYSQNHGNRRAIVDIVVPGLSIVWSSNVSSLCCNSNFIPMEFFFWLFLSFFELLMCIFILNF